MMKIAILQFNPTLGAVHENIARADALLKEARVEGRLDGVQLLIGPEMAFTGRSDSGFNLLVSTRPVSL